MGDTVILAFLNEHCTNNRLHIRAGDEDHGHENAHPPACSAVHKKEQHKGEISYSTTFDQANYREIFTKTNRKKIEKTIFHLK